MTIANMMIKTLMDEITDANMMIDYAEESKEQRHADAVSFFRIRAKKRIDALDMDMDKLDEIMHISQKANAGDDMSSAFLNYINGEIDKLNNRFAAL